MSGHPVAYALTAHGFVDQVGSYAGFAAIIGIALLVIVLFVHARENAELRARAQDAEDRLVALEERLERRDRAQAVAPQGVSPQVATPPTGARSQAPAAAVVATASPAASRPALPDIDMTRLIPAAPVGVGAPALASATRLIPAVEPPAVVNGTAAAVAPPPQTAAGGGNGSGRIGAVPVVAPPPNRADVPARPAPPPPPRAPRGAQRIDGGSADRGSRVRLGSLLVAAALLAIIAAAVVLVITRRSSGSTNGGSGAASSTRTTNAPSRRTRTVQVNPTTVTVAVLNGTSTANLAHDVLSKLTQNGFRRGATGNASDQTHTTTIVGYLPGSRTKALAVARALDRSQTTVRPVSAPDREVACSSAPSACPDQVVVTVGSDLASGA